MSKVLVRRALVSVYDKAGLVGFAKELAAAGVEIVSSGGTAAAIEQAGLTVTRVADVTGAPEILGGRVKTLHPAIHGGILADPALDGHQADLDATGIELFELVVANLYPFREAAATAGATDAEVIEQIDIGGPAMVRAAAKNHRRVGVVTSPAQYAEVGAAVAAGGLDDEQRLRLAREAFLHTAAYDAAIVGWLERHGEPPERLVLALRRHSELRYGENPHQPAAAYAEEGAAPWWAKARMLQGKELSFNNLLDAEAAWRLVTEFAGVATVVVKHTNPCGAAEAASPAESFVAAWDGDPLAAFGSVIGLNHPLDAATAALIADRFVEVVVAPEVDAEAAELLAARKNLRVLVAPAPSGHDPDMRRLEAGLLWQRRDRVGAGRAGWEVAGSRAPTEAEWADLEFAWPVVAHAKSNAVVIARNRTAVGIGAGDQSRVGAAERAVRTAGERAVGAVAASDAFFPFPDGVELLAGAGVTAIVQPGGSRRDAEVVAAADAAGVAMVTTGTRHFRH